MPKPARVAPDEIRQVQPRVGLTPKARLQWALDFARKDFQTLTVGDLANLQREFLAFAEFLITPDEVNDPTLRAMLAGQPNPRPPRRGAQSRGAALETVRWVNSEPRPLPSRTTLLGAQFLWQQMIRPLLEPNGVVFDIGAFKVTADVHRLDQRARSRIHLTAEQDPHAQLQIAALLGAYAHLLRVCPEPACQRWFVATRRGQTFCGRTCQNRATIRQFRAARKAETREDPRRPRTTP